MSNAIIELIQSYLDVWNERVRARRLEAIHALLTEDTVYIDPGSEAVVGPEAINEMIGQAQEKFGDCVFSIANVINAHHDLVLFTWHFGEPDGSSPAATGYDVVQFDNGKVLCVWGFFE